ncbi:MAG: hypothetical protein OEL77_07890 [Nitrosopumilus sp.]|nr:hypothetical protein [Nitrosopumilus sp.]MDH3385917.1 hypothetical protein [Nitrosopumilus sp.]
MNFKYLVLFLILVPGIFGNAFGHTVDSVGEYRLEIGWMNEPVVSGETNAIELFVSPLEPGSSAEEQNFKNGISGLEKSLKMQLILTDHKITLPFSKDHDIPGKYYAFVNPTVAGFYQVNILGNIGDTTVSLSMHPPKVDERSYIEFPESADLTLNQLIDGHTAVVGEVNDLKESVAELEKSNQQMNFEYIAIGLGIIAIVIAVFALGRTKNS